MQLSEHFALEEFVKGDPIPDDCIPIFRRLAMEILEPVRVQFGHALIITSGYRSEHQNAEAHGQPNSEHIATPWKCACDFYVAFSGVMRPIFDWMRNNQRLPYHQLIYETNEKGAAVIHVSINVEVAGVRSVLQGSTHNSSAYTAVDHVAFLEHA